jgi:hypothetical protein
MFEVGREYTFTMLMDGTQTEFTDEVAEVDLPLIKLRNPHDGEKIVNTGSAAFVSAKMRPYRSPEKKAASRAEWGKLVGTLNTTSDEV